MELLPRRSADQGWTAPWLGRPSVIRLVLLIAVVAFLWTLFVHPERLVYTLGGFAAGVAFMGSLPWFVRWGQQIAKDSQDMPLASKGVRIPITVDNASPDDPQCPDHPLWTWREQDGSRRCTKLSPSPCKWTFPAPSTRTEHLRPLRRHQEATEDALRAAGVAEAYMPPTRARNN